MAQVAHSIASIMDLLEIDFDPLQLVALDLSDLKVGLVVRRFVIILAT